jgi:hypothetical protein
VTCNACTVNVVGYVVIFVVVYGEDVMYLTIIVT